MKFSSKGENKMKEGKNIILAISGQAGVGKTTTVEELEKVLKELGIEVNKRCVGKDSRPLILERYMQYLREEHPEIKEPEKMTIDDAHADPKFSTIIRKELDAIIDADTVRFGEEVASTYTPNTWHIGEGRMAWFFIPDAISIMIVANDEAKGKRAFNDKSRGFKSEEEAAEACKLRSEEERKRYLARYGIDLADLSNYDIILDTSNLTPREAALKLIQEVIKFRKKEVEADTIEQKKEDEGR